MKILVMLKQTPDTETQIVISKDAKSIDHSQTKFIINPYDEFAIEEALRIQEKNSNTEVVLVCFGPESARERLTKGLAMGADRALIINNQGFENLDALAVSKILAAAIRSEKPDLVFCRKQAIDDDNMQVGVMTAELLAWPHVNVVTLVELNGNTLRIEREVEGGQKEVYEAKMPILLGAHKSLNSPRYASLPGIMKAKKKPFDIKTPRDFGIEESTLTSTHQVTVESYAFPPEKPKGKIFKGEPVDQMVAKVVKLLREEAKVL